MQIAFTAHLPFSRSRTQGSRPARRDVAHAREAGMTRTEKARRSAANQDQALYACGCGYAFTAPVSTTVGCPHCGTPQAW